MNIQSAYTKWSTTYDTDRNLTRDLDHTVTNYFIKDVLPKPHKQVILEIGCGTGKNTEVLAEFGKKVCGFDFSLGMLSKAKAKVQAKNVFFSVADLTRLWPVRPESIDLVSCNLVLEHISDLHPIFAEASRALVTGGQFFISELHPFRQYQGTRANFNREDERIEIDAFTHHISDFMEAAENHGFVLRTFKEWWHEQDRDQVPRLVSFLFVKGD